MKIKCFFLAAICMLLLMTWVRWSGLSRSPREALERASENSFFSENYIHDKFLEHLKTKGLSPGSFGLLYAVEDGVEEMDSSGDEKLRRKFKSESHPPLNLLCMDCPKYFKLHSIFGFYWVSIEP